MTSNDTLVPHTENGDIVFPFLSNTRTNEQQSGSASSFETRPERNKFQKFFKCTSMMEYPTLSLETNRKQHSLHYGDNIIIPQEELEEIMQKNIQLPLVVEVFVWNKKTRSVTAVVTDYTSSENKAYFPDWLVNTVGGIYNCLLRVQEIKLPPGEYAKFRALDNEFMNLYDPYAIISYHIRNNFRTLTQGKEITIVYLTKTYRFLIEETKPEPKIAIFETNLQVDLVGTITVPRS